MTSRVCAKNKRALQWQRTRAVISLGEKLFKWPYLWSYGFRDLEEVWVILRYLMRGFWKSWNSSSYRSISKNSWNLGIMLMDMFSQLQVKLGSFKFHCLSEWSLYTAKPWQTRLLIGLRESSIFTDLVEPQLIYNVRRKWLLLLLLSRFSRVRPRATP